MSLKITDETTFLLDMKNEDASSVLADGNTAAWYEALLEYMTLNGADISQWNDKSGNSNHLLQAVASAQPPWSTGGIVFNGSTEYMKDTFTLIQPEFIYMVFKQITWTANDVILDGAAASTGKMQQVDDTPDIEVYAGLASAADSNLALDTWGIARVLFNGASSKFIIDDNTPVTGDFGSDDMGGFTIGAAATGVLPSNIRVKEIIIRSVADGATNEGLIYNYLKDKYSL